MICRGPDAANAVTDDDAVGHAALGAKRQPRRTALLVLGDAPRELAGVAERGAVELARPRPPSRLRSTRRTARPMHTDARSGPASTEWADDIPSCRRIGPFTTSSTAQPPVDAVAPCTRNSGRHTASTAARTTGKSGGRHPASTALMATFSAVRARCLTGSTPTTWSGGVPAQASMASTRSGVGATTGRPSVQPRSRNSSCTASSSTSMRRDRRVVTASSYSSRRPPSTHGPAG